MSVFSLLSRHRQNHAVFAIFCRIRLCVNTDYSNEFTSFPQYSLLNYNQNRKQLMLNASVSISACLTCTSTHFFNPHHIFLFALSELCADHRNKHYPRNNLKHLFLSDILKMDLQAGVYGRIFIFFWWEN